MISGRTAFSGKSRAALIGAILKDEPPPLSREQPLTPPLLDHIIARCLAKDPDQRWQSAADLAHELQWAAARPALVGHRLVRPLALVAIAAALVASAWAGVAYLRSGRPVDRPYRLSLLLPEGTGSIPVGPTRFAIAPDGRRLAFVASRQDGLPHL